MRITVHQKTELTLFKPFEAEKSSKLSYKGASEPKPKRIEIADTLGPPRVLFRKWYRNPTPAPGVPTNGDSTSPTSSVQQQSRPPRPQQHPQPHPHKQPPPSTDSFHSSSHDKRETTPKVTVVRPPPPPRQPVPKSEVLSRIGRLEKNQNIDGDLKKYWMPDKACKECSECQAKFNLIVRRHHCRICGRIFCNTCCSMTIPGVLLRPDLQGNLRVCKECLDIFQEFHSSKLQSESGSKLVESQGLEVGLTPRSPGPIGPSKSQLEPLQPPESPIARTNSSGNYSRGSRPINMMKSWDDTSSSRSQEIDLSPSHANVEFDNPASLRIISRRRQNSFDSLRSLATNRDERLLALDEDEVEFVVRDVWQHLLHPTTGLQLQNHRYRLRHFPNTLTAHDIVEWILKNGFARSRDVAIRVGQALVDTKRLNIVSSVDTIFKDENNLYLELGEAATIETDSIPTSAVTDAPKWFQHLPEDGDSELEFSTSLLNTDSSTMKVRYSQPPSSFTSDSASVFLESKNFQGPKIVVTSISELTGAKETGKEDKPTSDIPSESQEDYLVINSEGNNQTEDGTPTPDTPLGKDLAAQRSQEQLRITVPKPIPGSLSSFTNSQAFRSPRLLSYAMIDNQELLKALPVTGLSSAAAAAKDIDVAAEGSDGGDSVSQMRVKSNAEARSVFEIEHDHHFDALIIQQIKSFGLSLSWLGVIKPLIIEASRKVKTNLFSDDVMDVNHYIKVKKIPGSRKTDSALFHGVVCTKNVTHKKMNHSIHNPTILLLKCAFEFQRRENQLSSFDTLQLQEEKYLKNLVARVKTFKPSIILVQKSVSRLALEMLYELGIAVAVNVKPSIMARVARSTQGDLLHSLDQLFFRVRLGTCGNFYIRNFTLPNGVKKTLMYFDSCDPKFGCAITLQGGTNRELKKVKKIALLALHIAHNSRLETAFLVDEFAWPDSLTPTLLPDVGTYFTPPSTPEWPLFPSLSYPVEGISPAELSAKLAKLAPEVLTKESEDGENPCDGSAREQDQSDWSDQEKAGKEDPNAESSDQRTPVVSRQNSTGGSQTESRAESQTGSACGSTAELQAGLASPTAAASIRNIPADLGEREFRVAFENQIVSISPSIHISVPYLQTAPGMRADVRQYLPKVIYWSYQFKVKSPSTTSRDRESEYLSLQYQPASSLEMGITGPSLLASGVSEGRREAAHTSAINPPHRFTHSYKSVSDHPLTQAIFLQMANTNEMKAALADYRARAGLPDEPDCFVFPSARRAGDYQFHLEGIFKKYGQFETEETAPGSIPSKWDEIDTRAALEANNRKTIRRRVQRWKIPEKKPDARESSYSHSNSSSEGLQQPAEDSSSSQPEISKSIVAVSLDVRRGIARISKNEPVVDSSGKSGRITKEITKSGQHSMQEFTDDGQRISQSNKIASVGSKLSEKFGTLEDIDRGALCTAATEVENSEMLSEEWSFLGTDSCGMGLTPCQVDCMNPFNHQGISILFSSTCHDGQKHQRPCVPPCTIPMNYYGRNDISLGEFLHRYCFRQFYHCQSCGVDMTKHQRHIIHGDSAISISMQELEADLPGGDGVISTWLTCRHCSQCTPFIQMSADSLLFSFAKFLELKFHTPHYMTRYHGNGNSECKHSLHGSYIQYFCENNMIAAFEPSNISILEVCVPPRVISITTPHSEYHHNYSTEIRHVHRITEGVFYRIKQRLQQYNMEPVSVQVKEHIASSKAERDAFRSKIWWLKDLVINGGFFPTAITIASSQSMSEEERDETFFTLQDGISDFKRSLTEVVDCWNIHLEGLDTTVKIHRSRKLDNTSDGHHSPRDSPQNVVMETDSPLTSPHGITPRDTPLSTPCASPPPVMTPPMASPDWSIPSHQTSSTGGKSRSTSTSMLGHSRNLSDSGVHRMQENMETPQVKWPGHKRQLSDSFAMAPSGGDTRADSSKKSEQMRDNEQTDSSRDESRPESRSSLDGTGSESESKGAQNRERGSSSNLYQPPGRNFPFQGDVEYQSVKTIFGPPKVDLSTQKFPHNQTSPQGEDGNYPDTAVGIFAKLRGKDTEPREDPTKFYLVDPAEITNSPTLGLHPQANTLDPPAPRPYRRPGTIPRKAPANTAISSTEAFGDGRGSEKRLAKDRSVLARPFQKLPHPFEPNEHHNMHKSLRIPVAIYEKEPTSLIAYALSSREYVQELKKVIEWRQGAMMAELKGPPSPKLLKRPPNEVEKPQASSTSKGSTLKSALQELRKKGSAISVFSGLSTSTSEQLDPFDKFSEDAKKREGSLLGSGKSNQMGDTLDMNPESGNDLEGTKWSVGPELASTAAGSRCHISLEFTDRTASFFCKVYFAEEFHRLREHIFPSGEDRFIRSLARCVKYDAKGGKTKSAFCKVVDDRFILKQIKSVEISSFEQFAPHYFDHVNRALEEKRPLVLAKILGVYSIGYRNTKTGNSKRLDVIVMENLLYGHSYKSSKVFDLKGSMRSRYINPSNNSSDVLLDENYLNYICYNPVYVYHHSKCVLMQAIQADTEFLARNSIMDYSLLTCIDEEAGQLAVGIIDYVRTFTLDKRLEMHLKKAAGRVLPTVVYPELYRKRFCQAMEHYFTVVPDKWTGLGQY